VQYEFPGASLVPPLILFLNGHVNASLCMRRLLESFIVRSEIFTLGRDGHLRVKDFAVLTLTGIFICDILGIVGKKINYRLVGSLTWREE
jgi:hypothetical protein